MAAKYGFTHAEIETTEGTIGNYTKATVLFLK
jgi:hypothetical protein